VLVLSSVLRGSPFESFEYVQTFWSTLIGSIFKKKTRGTFFIFSLASVVFYEYSPYYPYSNKSPIRQSFPLSKCN
jgi:hypothetical protein